MSEHSALVVDVVPHKHPNADALSLVNIGGFQVVINTQQWAGITKGIYILPDSIVEVCRPEFAFLDKGRLKERVKCVRLRGEYSQGLLIPTSNDAIVGTDHWERLGLEWYEPEAEAIGGGTKADFKAAPPSWGGLSKYDVENGRRSEVQDWFVPGEEVFVTAKLNGSNCSYVFSDGEMHVRSRSGFREQSGNVFWTALKNTPEVEAYCRSNPDVLVYGEAYGEVKHFKYDCAVGPKFRVFDVMRADRTFLNWEELQVLPLPLVPLIAVMVFDMDKLIELAEAPCPLSNPISEGIVVKPLVDRRCGNHRVMMKIVSNQYLMKS